MDHEESSVAARYEPLIDSRSDEPGATSDADSEQRPSEVWLILQAQGLIKHRYRGKRNRPSLKELGPRASFTGTTEDILRSLGRLDER